MLQMDFASTCLAPCAVVMVPVASVVRASCNGTPYMLAPQAAYWPHQSGLAIQHPMSQAGAPASSDQASAQEQIHQHLDVSASPELTAKDEQPSSKKSIRRLMNKKVAPERAGLPITNASFRLSAKMIEVDKKLMCRTWETWRATVRNADEEEARTVASKFQEQVLRLTLLGLKKPDADISSSEIRLRRTTSLIADFAMVTSTALTERTSSAGIVSETSTTIPGRSCSIGFTSELEIATPTERTVSVKSDIASCTDSSSVDDALSDFGFLTSVPTWELPRVIRSLGDRRRVGVDLGGVVLVNNATKLVKKAIEGVRGLVHFFGANDVFIVSRVELESGMHKACCKALTKSGGFLEKTGIPFENVVFVRAVKGPFGKGKVSARLGLTDFVDDRVDVLHSVCADEAGNSGHLVRQFKGKLFHFEHGGLGTRRPSERAKIPCDFKDHYHAVAGWADVLACFGGSNVTGVTVRASVFTKSEVDVRRIPINVEEDDSRKIVDRLATGFAEIEDFSGVKIFLRGKGSPHPQPKSEEQGPLSIVLRTKPDGSGALDSAVSLVEILLREVLALPSK